MCKPEDKGSNRKIESCFASSRTTVKWLQFPNICSSLFSHLLAQRLNDRDANTCPLRALQLKHMKWTGAWKHLFSMTKEKHATQEKWSMRCTVHWLKSRCAKTCLFHFIARGRQICILKAWKGFLIFSASSTPGGHRLKRNYSKIVFDAPDKTEKA